MVYDLQPNIDWHKGRAVEAVLGALDQGLSKSFPIYIGDDVTDEDAFRAIRDSGVGVVVKGGAESTFAAMALADVDDVGRFLDALVQKLDRRGELNQGEA
jgi:trehalose-phosphatase